MDSSDTAQAAYLTPDDSTGDDTAVQPTLGESHTMPTLDVAHLSQQGVDLIIAPRTSGFGFKTPQDQEARGAGLAGTVVPVWEGGDSRMAFRASRAWHPFFRRLSCAVVRSNVHKRIYW